MYPGLTALMPSVEAQSVKGMGWESISNGSLLGLAREQFEAFVTLDKGILHQHDHRGSSLILLVVRLPNNRRQTQIEAIPMILDALTSAQPGDVIEVG